MPTEVLMPALSPTMEKGNLAKWLKKEGDKVKSGDVIAEIETDKATMEVEAADEGTLGKILVPEGTADVAVNTPIAVILARARTRLRSNQPSLRSNKSRLNPHRRRRHKIRQVKASDTPAPKPAKAPQAPAPQAANDPDIPEGTEWSR